MKYEEVMCAASSGSNSRLFLHHAATHTSLRRFTAGEQRFSHKIRLEETFQTENEVYE